MWLLYSNCFSRLSAFGRVPRFHLAVDTSLALSIGLGTGMLGLNVEFEPFCSKLDPNEDGPLEAGNEKRDDQPDTGGQLGRLPFLCLRR